MRLCVCVCKVREVCVVWYMYVGVDREVWVGRERGVCMVCGEGGREGEGGMCTIVSLL